MLDLDANTEFGARVARRLREERVIWLVTVRADGTPQPTPVWFLWDNETFLIYSRPKQQKLKNIARNPRVALHFDGDGQGGDIVVFSVEARIQQHPPSAQAAPAYIEKYQKGLQRLGDMPAGFARTFSVAIRVTPTGLRGH